MTKHSKKAKRQKLSKKNDDLNLTDSSSSSDSSSDSDSSTSSSSSSSSSNSSSSSSSGSSSSTNSSNLSSIDIKTLDANKRLPGDEAPRSKSISYQQQHSTKSFRGGRAGRGAGVRVRGGSFSNRATYINHQHYAQQPASTPSPQPTPRTSTDSSSTATTTAGGGGGGGGGTALKLVLKRAGGGNSYKVTSLNAYSANRPKREAAQRAENLYKHLIEDENDEMADVEEDVEYERPTKVSSRRQSANTTNVSSSVQYYQQPAIKKRRQSSATTTNSSTSTSMHAISEQDWIDEQLEHQKPQEFYPSDIVQGVSIEDKMLILLKKQCYVRLNHPKPFAIALVDDETSIVHTKALLLNHLFQSYQSPCILCVLCKQFLTVQQFSKHLHDNKPTKKQQSFSILPYSTSGSISPSDMQTWKLFSKLYAKYKNENKKLKEQHQQQQQQQAVGGEDEGGVSRISTTSVSSIVSTKSSGGGGGGIASSKKFKSFQGQIFYDWDYIEKSTNKAKNLYWLSILRLNHENIVYVNENSKIDAPINQHNNKEKQKDDLVLSDDEDADHTPTTAAAAAVTTNSNGDDTVSNKENHEMDVDVEVKSPAQTEATTTTTTSANTSTHVVDHQMPSISKLYMNFYDNLSYDILLYICDNQYTIIPISYIEFINYKRNQIINNYSINTKIINNYSLINSY